VADGQTLLVLYLRLDNLGGTARFLVETDDDGYLGGQHQVVKVGAVGNGREAHCCTDMSISVSGSESDSRMICVVGAGGME
jgi:hypothetical protein